MPLGLLWLTALLSLSLVGCVHPTGASRASLPVPAVCELQKEHPLLCPPSPASPAYLNSLLIKEVEMLYAIPVKDLPQEIAKLENATDLHAKVKLVVLLTRTQQPANTQNALRILEEIKIQGQADPNNAWLIWAQLLHPIIREQHALHVKLAQQKQQLRDNTKLIEELNQKLNDLRAIEESLHTRTSPLVIAPEIAPPPAPGTAP